MLYTCQNCIYMKHFSQKSWRALLKLSVRIWLDNRKYFQLWIITISSFQLILISIFVLPINRLYKSVLQDIHSNIKLISDRVQISPMNPIKSNGHKPRDDTLMTDTGFNQWHDRTCAASSLKQRNHSGCILRANQMLERTDTIQMVMPTQYG